MTSWGWVGNILYLVRLLEENARKGNSKPVFETVKRLTGSFVNRITAVRDADSSAGKLYSGQIRDGKKYCEKLQRKRRESRDRHSRNRATNVEGDQARIRRHERLRIRIAWSQDYCGLDDRWPWLNQVSYVRRCRRPENSQGNGPNQHLSRVPRKVNIQCGHFENYSRRMATLRQDSRLKRSSTET